ncbi:neuraminidase [Pedobacter sp. HMF7647]|uniref:Neuraminidase n=2 Tax=Hufsiella arboris TaxID=2695275 RepID=A0A7K1Y7Q9_9SPHI|nr:neuraminidase [Hufsiella arboris]
MTYSKFLLLLLLLNSYAGFSQKVHMSTVSNDGWAGNSVNTIIFRKNSVISYKDNQYVAYYNQNEFVTIARRKLGSDKWELHPTSLKGDAADAHKSISIMIDGQGYLHLVWGQHNNSLNYVRSVKPGSFEFTDKLSMTSKLEEKLSYPEFYRLPDGNLLFFYRDGGSGNGNLIVNKYAIKKQQWTRLQDNLINGEGQRSAYWQVASDKKGVLHVSWVWRETPDVASNHDMAYACSKDGGLTWQKSTGENYKLPITAATAEYAARIPKNSELINQTSMFADYKGRPFIATYWKEQGESVPQFHLVFNADGKWIVKDLKFRKTSFSLSGMGTKSIPVSRPQIVAWTQGDSTSAAVIFRDADSDSKISVAITSNIEKDSWQILNLTDESYGSWEPSYDTELWKDKKLLHLFVQKVDQVDGEGKSDIRPQPVKILEWNPLLTVKNLP